MLKSYFIPLLILLLFFSCKKKDEDCNKICEAPVKQLLAETENWVPYSGSDTLFFEHSGGRFTAEFIGKYWATTYFPYTLESCCGTMQGSTPSRNVVYEATNVPLNLAIDHYKAISGNNTQTDTEMGDLLKITIATNQFWLPLHKELFTGNFPHEIEILDSLHWGNKTYRQVYHLFYHTYDERFTYVKGMYFVKNEGIVGFYYNNNEQWYIKN